MCPELLLAYDRLFTSKFEREQLSMQIVRVSYDHKEEDLVTIDLLTTLCCFHYFVISSKVYSVSDI